MPHSQPRHSQRHGAVLDRGSGGGAGVLDRPGFETLGPGGGPATDSAGANLDSSGGRGLGGGSWRVLLIDSDKHTEERCVDAITTGEQAGTVVCPAGGQSWQQGLTTQSVAIQGSWGRQRNS